MQCVCIRWRQQDHRCVCGGVLRGGWCACGRVWRVGAAHMGPSSRREALKYRLAAAVVATGCGVLVADLHTQMAGDPFTHLFEDSDLEARCVAFANLRVCVGQP